MDVYGCVSMEKKKTGKTCCGIGGAIRTTPPLHLHIKREAKLYSTGMFTYGSKTNDETS